MAMNRFAYRMTGFAIDALYKLSKANVKLHDIENIPDGGIIFVINHFTRIETMLMPTIIFKLTRIPVWSLAYAGLFKGPLSTMLDKVGAVSTKDPNRDRLIVKTLMTGEATWIIFPEGRMVKNKKIVEKGQFIVSFAGGKHPPHTGSATLALRSEFYRQRILHMAQNVPQEAERLMQLFDIEDIETISNRSTYIVPVNITYYPIRARENILSQVLVNLVEDLPERFQEEVVTEGSMLLSGVDIDIRFGKPLQISDYMTHPRIQRDIATPKEINFDDPISSKNQMRKLALKIMQQYMAAIYNITTVNYDHLFATIIRGLPYKKIDEYELRQRVFLAATTGICKAGVCVNHLLEKDQLHLLTDDRFGRVEDFLGIASEKGVIKRQSNDVIKDPSKFSSSFDFHRVRIDNPIAVAANAVEPLQLLRRNLRRISWMPGFWLRRKLTEYLQQRITRQFDHDYQQFYIEGETKKKKVGRPFLVHGRGHEIGVLLIHGYMAAPLEVRELARFLGRRGITVYAPRLRGHGTSPEDLAKRTYKDWITSVDEGYAVLRTVCRRVAVGGFSTGAGLALDLAARIPDIVGVFAVSPPMRLQRLSPKFVPALDAWNRMMNLAGFQSAKMEFVENRPENPHINYSRNPIAGVRQMERLMDTLETKLSKIRAPALLAQSFGDPVVDHRGTRRIFEALGSDDKEFVLFNFDRHGILLGHDAHRVHRAIGNFILHLKEQKGKGHHHV